MAKKKYYAVKVGRKTGIFSTWAECEKQVKGFGGAIFKGFEALDEAKSFLGKNDNNIDKININRKAIFDNCKNSLDVLQSVGNYAFVDGSFNVKTGVYGYGGFLIADGEKYIISGNGSDKEMASMRNVAGEILGSMAAIKKAIELNIPELDIYYDYMGIEMWATGNWKRNKEGTKEYFEYIQNIKDKIKLNFKKVKGHSGIDGNEEADILAKKAAGIIS